MPNVVHQEGQNIQLQITVYTTVNKGRYRDVESFSVSRSMKVGGCGGCGGEKVEILQSQHCIALYFGH